MNEQGVRGGERGGQNGDDLEEEWSERGETRKKWEKKNGRKGKQKGCRGNGHMWCNHQVPPTLRMDLIISIRSLTVEYICFVCAQKK